MLIQKIQCPNGCQNAVITESVKIVKSQNENLLLEHGQSYCKKVKVCTCDCCKAIFEISVQDSGNNLLCS
jgi:hypothetical protein